MGSCISKCRTKKKLFKKDCDAIQIHDKLVISQDPKSSSVPNSIATPVKRSNSPSQSSFSCNSSTTKLSTMASSVSLSSSSTSSSCCSSSVLSAKDRSFSNEFLWSCVKENPHIIGMNSPMIVKENPKKIHPQNLQSSMQLSPLVLKTKLSIQETPKKRARENSPTLVRQKSFRKEQNSACSIPSKGHMRSPSPSRRFNGTTENNTSFLTNGSSDDQNSCRHPIISKSNVINSLSYNAKRENFRGPTASPNRELTINRNISVKKRTDILCQQVSAKIESVGVGLDIQNKQGLMDIVMEDVNNPLIALDCFIFL